MLRVRFWGGVRGLTFPARSIGPSQQLRGKHAPSQGNWVHIKLPFYFIENESTVKEIKLLKFEDLHVQINAPTHTSPQLKKRKKLREEPICQEKKKSSHDHTQKSSNYLWKLQEAFYDENTPLLQIICFSDVKQHNNSTP